MTFYDFLEKENIHPKKMKNTDIGLVFSYNQETDGRGHPKKGLIVIGHSNTIGLIKTLHAPLCFTQIDNSFYYGYWNFSLKCYQIGSIDFDGVEKQITKGWVIEMQTTSDNRCVVISKISGRYKMCLQYVNPDGTTECIIKTVVDSLKDLVITKNGDFLILDDYGVLKVTPVGTSQRIVFTDVLPNCYNLNYLEDRILFINDRKLMCYKVDKYQNSKEGQLILDERILYKKDIGRYIKGFHIIKGEKGGEIIIWTNKGIYEAEHSFKLPNPIYRNRLPYLWNPKLVEVLKLSKQAYCYARTFMLCMNRILETDETLPELPDELLCIILSHSDTWRFPEKTLMIL
jgi:hypothetical protein